MEKAGAGGVYLLSAGSLFACSTVPETRSRSQEKEYSENSLRHFQELVDPEDSEVERIAEATGFGVLTGLVVKFPEEVSFERASDEEVHGEEDVWADPSTYIENDFRGDCDDYSIFTTSVLNAHEKDMEARSVLDVENEHVYTELKYDGGRWITDVRAPDEFFTREAFRENVEWEPAYMVNSQVAEEYDPEW